MKDARDVSDLMRSSTAVVFHEPGALDAIAAIALLGEYVHIIKASAPQTHGRALLIHTGSGMCFATAQQTVEWLDRVVGNRARSLRDRITTSHGCTLYSLSGTIVGIERQAATYLLDHGDFQGLDADFSKLRTR